jgi:hypothetical protein
VGCTDDSCNPASGCVYTPDDSYCNNGLFCDGEEYCDPDKDCQDGTPVNCDDEEVCTDDRCSEAKDKCVHEFDGLR